jgi:hypothetical protein
MAISDDRWPDSVRLSDLESLCTFKFVAKGADVRPVGYYLMAGLVLWFVVGSVIGWFFDLPGADRGPREGEPCGPGYRWSRVGRRQSIRICPAKKNRCRRQAFHAPSLLCSPSGCENFPAPELASGREHPLRSIVSLLIVAAFFLLIGIVSYVTRYVPTAEEVEFDEKFDREAVLVKTCGPEPGIAVAIPQKVFRFREKLWYRDRNRWRVIDRHPENVCDLLDVEKGHEPKPGPLPPGWSRSN